MGAWYRDLRCGSGFYLEALGTASTFFAATFEWSLHSSPKDCGPLLPPFPLDSSHSIKHKTTHQTLGIPPWPFTCKTTGDAHIRPGIQYIGGMSALGGHTLTINEASRLLRMDINTLGRETQDQRLGPSCAVAPAQALPVCDAA